MSEGSNFNIGADFSGLAEARPPTPEIIDDDDDEVEEAPAPKTLLEYLKQDTEVKKAEEPAPEAKAEAETDELESDPTEDQDVEIGTAEAFEGTTDVPEMTPEEEQEASTAILENRQEEIHEEVESAPDDNARDEALAAGVFVESTKKSVEEGMSLDEAVKEGRSLALGALGIETPPEITDEPESEPELETEPDSAESEQTTLPNIANETQNPTDSEATEPPEDPPASSPTNSASSATVPPVINPAVPFGGAGAGFGGPGGPGGGGSGRAFGHGGFGPGGGNFGGNTAPMSPNNSPNFAPEDSSDRRRGTGRYVLAGGIVGYMLGRRRGRIKTEKKLLPIQHKLEKEVKGLHDKLAWHESSVRNLVQEQLQRQPHATEVHANRQATKVERGNSAEKDTNDRREGSLESRQKPYDIHSPENIEKVGSFAMMAERPNQSEKNKPPEKLKPVELMTIPELLQWAEKIEVEQSNLKQLYESNRIDYEGLRRIVRAYLRGERYDNILRENLLSSEKLAYHETLHTEGAGADQTNPQNTSPQDAMSNATNSQNIQSARSPINPISSVNQVGNYGSHKSEGDDGRKPQVVAVVAGVFVAIIILIFLLAR